MLATFQDCVVCKWIRLHPRETSEVIENTLVLLALGICRGHIISQEVDTRQQRPPTAGIWYGFFARPLQPQFSYKTPASWQARSLNSHLQWSENYLSSEYMMITIKLIVTLPLIFIEHLLCVRYDVKLFNFQFSTILLERHYYYLYYAGEDIEA